MATRVVDRCATPAPRSTRSRRSCSRLRGFGRQAKAEERRCAHPHQDDGKHQEWRIAVEAIEHGAGGEWAECRAERERHHQRAIQRTETPEPEMFRGEKSDDVDLRSDRQTQRRGRDRLAEGVGAVEQQQANQANQAAPTPAQ